MISKSMKCFMLKQVIESTECKKELKLHYKWSENKFIEK